MNISKKMVAIILALAMMVGLCSFAQAENTEGYKIGFCNYAVSNSWQTQMEAEFK